MGKIKGISHITFVCKDIKKTSKFLEIVFDAKEMYASGDEKFSISKEKFFMIGELWVAIMEGAPVQKTYNHIAFKVNKEDLSLMETKIRQLGLEILPGRSREPEEAESLYFYDYDNHLFELHTGTLKTRLLYYQSGWH